MTAILLAATLLTGGWEEESLSAIRARMAFRDSVMQAWQAESISGTKFYDSLTMGDTFRFNDKDLLVGSFEATVFTKVKRPRNEKDKNPDCMVIHVHSYYAEPEENKPATVEGRNFYIVIWRDQVRRWYFRSPYRPKR